LNYKLDSSKTSYLSNLSSAGINNAIYQNGIVIIGTDVSDHWWLPNWNNILPLQPSDAGNPTVSGHCVVLYAFGEPWSVQLPTNTWGVNWWSSAWGYIGRFCYGANYTPEVYEAAVVSM